MPGPSTRVLLVRHAQHDTSVEDGGLTALGERQAEALRGTLGLRAEDALVASPLQRAVATAAALREDFEVVGALEEFVFGPAAPRMDELMAERADLTLWRAEHGFPGGETLGAFQSRVATTMQGLVADHPGARVVAVTHSGFIDAALRWAYGVPTEHDWITEAVVQNASVTEIEHWPSGRHEPGAPRFSVIHRVGDVTYLAHDLVTEI